MELCFFEAYYGQFGRKGRVDDLKETSYDIHDLIIFNL